MKTKRTWWPRTGLRLVLSLLLSVSLVIASALVANPAYAGTGGTSTTPPFNECPAVGSDTSCGVLFIIQPDGSVTVLVDGSQGPFDTPPVEDTLVGVLNNSGLPVTSLVLTSTSNAFGFEGDGICSAPTSPQAPGCPFATTTTGYEGPDNTFTVVDGNHGTVNFTGTGLAPGGSTYFGLEGNVTPQSLEFPLTAQPAAVNAVEGQLFSGTVAAFTDSDASDPADAAVNDVATITWGDGSSGPGTITSLGGGKYSVSGSHTYADEGTPTVAVSISDPDDPGGPATTSSTATVADAALTNAAGTTVTGTEGQPISAATVATFTDQNPGATTADFTSGGGSATINWGDASTSPGVVTQTGPGQFAVSGSHTYADEGSYPISVSIIDDGGSTVTAGGTANISDAALSAVGSPDFVSTNPVSHTLATFTDQNLGATTADFTSGGGSTTINWGDASTSPGVVTQTGPGQFAVSGSHTYAALGPYTITVNIVDDGGSTATAVTHVIVFAFAPGGGGFVIGDHNSANGTAVTFWGAQWAKSNTLSGGSAPASFKGFEDSTKPPTCGTGWTTDPGNSTPPPSGPLPSYMGVIVANSITQSGSTISGNTPHIVVVTTNPGYAPNPGHAGTGTVVAQVC
jgi:hypothetical protein